MIFYNFNLRWKQYNPHTLSMNSLQRNEFELKYTDNFLENYNDTFYYDFCKSNDYLLTISSRDVAELSIVAAVNVNSFNLDGIMDRIEKDFSDCLITQKGEITVDDYRLALESGRHINFPRKIEGKLKIDYRGSGFFDPTPYEWEQQVFDAHKMNRSEARQRASKIIGSDSLFEEIDRIYSKKNAKGYYGHPVHYMVSAGDWGGIKDIYEILLNALYSNNRLQSNRLSIFKNFHKNAYRDERYRQHITASEGGIVIIELGNNSDMGRFATDFHEFTKITAEMMNELKKDTLFIFVEIMGQTINDNDSLSYITGSADIIQITEGSGTAEDAHDYLKDLVDKAEFDADDMSEVYKYLPEKESYTVTDIYNAYNNWYGSGLKNHIYKAYKQEDCFHVELTEKENKPYDSLRELIGLDSVKDTIDRIVEAYKVAMAREKMGLKVEKGCRNMLFAGNPGTAKTTIARLLAEVLKEEGVLKSGRLIECGRKDLVGKYVGWTARIVADLFKAADGGILFIDEAYSLVEDGNTYGAEAINTITQMMENYRERVIVIFAGYPEKMKEFLDQNEGLRSRIAFHLNFPDYSPAELTDIINLHAKRRDYQIEESALEKCNNIFADAVREENFGNGRYARNLLERAIINQSSRIFKEHEGEDLTPENMCLLKAEDFEPITIGVENCSSRKIGFSL